MLLCGALFFVAFGALAQRTRSDNPIDIEANRLAARFLAPDLSGTVRFSQTKKWDSVLVYSNRVLNKSKGALIEAFAHYYRGFAFREKGLHKFAMKEFNAVNPNFEFYFRIQILQGELCLEQGDFSRALGYFNKIDTTNKEQLKTFNLDGLQHNIGLCYFHLNKFKEAEEYLLLAISGVEKRKDQNELIGSYMDLGNVYYEQYFDEKAISYFEKAYQLSKKHGSFILKQNAALNMAVVEENRNRSAEALAYRKEYESWRDSLTDQNKIYEVAQLEKKFAVNQKQRQVKLLETENKLKQTELNMYLFAASFLLIILVFGIYFYRQNVLRSRIILKQKQELDLLNAAKDQLFSIVSHDLRSSVHALKMSNTSLKEKVEKQEYQMLEDQLEQNSSIATNTYNMLDNLLHWALLQTEGGYFKQEEHRLGMIVDQVAYNFRGILKQKNIHFENQLPKSVKVFVDAESLKIVLRNFMDNSIKFSDENATISVVLKEQSDLQVCFEWQDNGKGMSEDTRLKLLSDSQQLTKKVHEKEIGSGLGMNLCKAMLSKNQGKLDIWSELNEGTKMIVILQKGLVNGKD